MSKQKKKRDDYKGYYPDEVKCGGKGGYGGNFNSNRRNNNNSHRNDNNNGYRKNTFGSSTDAIRTQRNNYTADATVTTHGDRNDRREFNRENTRPRFNKAGQNEHKKPAERTYRLPQVKEVEGKLMLPIEYSKFGLSTIKLLTLGAESLIVIDGKYVGPKTALVINDRDPEKGFKAAVVLNVGDYVVITTKVDKNVDGVRNHAFYKVVETLEKTDADNKMGYAVVEEVESLPEAVDKEFMKALKNLDDANYVYAKPKTKKVDKTNE